MCIARALALNPEVILFDEPCSALDPMASGVVEDLISSLAQKATIVLVSHDIAQARRIADQIAVFWFKNNAGRLVEVCCDKDQFEKSTHPITRCFIDGTRCWTQRSKPNNFPQSGFSTFGQSRESVIELSLLNYLSSQLFNLSLIHI